MKKTSFYIVFLVSLFCSVTALAQINIKVKTSDIIASGVSAKYGINLNAGVDHDTNRIEGTPPLATVISEIGAKVLRYPGGEKSNYFVWTEDPMDPDPTTNYWSAVYGDIALHTLNFDEFMSLCKQTGAEAHVNVPVNIWDTVTFTKTLAAEWVRYSNITKEYGVKYWEIGNEQWHPDKDNEWAKLSFDLNSMAELVIEYSNAMKAVDPTIKIGVSWKEGEMQQLINLCGSALDFVTITNYATYGGSYDSYKSTHNMKLLKVDKGLTLNTVISEFGSVTWAGDEWDLANNTGKGLINFDLIGQVLKSSKTQFASFWNTRWYDMAGHNHDALDSLNNILPVAQPFTLWNKFIKDDLVATVNFDPSIVCFAALDVDSDDLNVFLINKDTSASSVNLTISSDNNYGAAEVWQYKGVDEWDKNPTIGQVDSVAVSSNLIEYILPSTSITVFKLDTTTITSTTIVNTAEGITIYPNPVTGNYMRIKLNSSNSVSKVEIYDTEGKLKFAKNTFNQTDISVDVSSCQEGIYFVRIHNQKGVMNTKIMVL